MRINQTDQQTIRNDGREFIERLYHMVPPPAELTSRNSRDVYYDAMAEELGQAARTLQSIHDNTYVKGERNALLDKYYSMPIKLFNMDIPKEILENGPKWRRTDKAVDVDIHLRFGDVQDEERYVWTPRHTLQVAEGNAVREMLAPWIVQYMKMDIVLSNAISLFYDLVEQCRTPGQWATVFPQYTVLLSARMQQKIGARVRKSPWPKHLDKSIQGEKLKALANMFAKASVLPKYNKYDQKIIINNY